jgi:hypothetical protein
MIKQKLTTKRKEKELSRDEMAFEFNIWVM